MLLQVDEAVEVLEDSDQKLVKQEREACEATREAHSLLQLVYERKAESMHHNGAKASKRRKVSNPTVLRLPAHHISQSDAKKYLPPNTPILQGRTKDGWHGHCPPYRRVGHTFVKRGCSQLARKAIQRDLWTQHLSKTGQPVETCTVADLF